MHYLGLLRRIRRARGVSMTLSFALLYWALGIPLLFTTTSASAITQFTATASSSAPSVSTNYIVAATTTSQIGGSEATGASSTRITFDPSGNLFALTSLATATDVFISRVGGGLTQVADFYACSGAASEVFVSQIGRAQPADFVEFTTCPSDIVATGQILINLANAHVTNPSSTGSYIVRWGGGFTNASTTPATNDGDTRVAIINAVTVTASVDTNLTFTIGGLASSTIVNGDTTSTTTTPSPSQINFGYLSVGTSSIAGQSLSVSTNAANGFAVTVTQNQNLLSNSGADIDAFQDGAPAWPPVAWAAPSGAIGNEQTYGHMGVTSEDSTLPGGDLYSTSFYAGLVSTSTRTVMYNGGPADGTTPDVGYTEVAYRLQITALQEAASDYTNRLTYVCTPIF
jgi:hypothetical protein